MDWNEITEVSQINDVVKRSTRRPVLILKHSTRCSISSTAKHRLERHYAKLSNVYELYLVNVIRNRDVSNAIATDFSIRHESPQVFVFSNGRCVYNTSHLSIDAASLLDVIESET